MQRAVKVAPDKIPRSAALGLRRHRKDLPDARTRNILSRFTGAVTSDRVAEVAASGGIDSWFERQLAPGDILDERADALWSWFPTLAMTPRQRWLRHEEGADFDWAMMQDLASWVMLRRIITKRQVEELMVDFWSNVLHVASPYNDVWTWRVEYAQLIRGHALGRFDDLLRAAITHPAMGLYLGNVETTSGSPNERLGRDLLECYTVGIDACTESDIANSARILTGYHVDTADTWEQSYLPLQHIIGRAQVLGFSSANTDPDGRLVIAQYLSYLARHPATAKRLCSRLATRFMSDTPSNELVESLAAVYLASDTNIAPVLRALVGSEEFAASSMQKVRTPVEDAVASWTLNGSVVAEPHSPLDAANQLIFMSREMGQVPYAWSTADGFPDETWAWATSGRMAGTFGAHWRAASGEFPSRGITYRSAVDWLPPLPTTFDNVVDYLVRETLQVPCTPTMLRAACVATGQHPTDVITATSQLVTRRFPDLVVTLFDTPEHISR